MGSNRTLSELYLKALCERTFPNRPRQQLADITPLNSRQHEMTTFELWWYTDSGITKRQKFVARRYVSTLSWWRSDDLGKAQREATLVRWLQQEGFPVPEVFTREFTPNGDVTLFSHIDGYDLSSSTVSLVELISPYVAEVAQLLARLHMLTPTSEIESSLPRITLSYVLANLAALAAQIDVPELGEAIDKTMGRAFDIAEDDVVILHGDFHFLNILLQDQHIAGVVDWEYSALGDPRWDVANTYMQLVDFGAADAAATFLDVYTQETKRSFDGPPIYNVVAPLQQWTISEWLVQRQENEEEMSFKMAEEMIALRDVHRRRARMALSMLG